MSFISSIKSKSEGFVLEEVPEKQIKVDYVKKFVGVSLRKSLVLVGLVLFVVGAVLGFYGSQRNCLIVFITSGYMSFWTAMEILGGLIALTGIIIALIGYVRKD